LTRSEDDGIVVVRGREQDADMQADAVPAALRERLGADATDALLELLDRAYREQKGDMIAAVTERFERRLVEEIGSVRVQLAQVEAGIRQDMAAGDAALRMEIAALGAALRREMGDQDSSLRREIADLRASLRQELADQGASLRQEIAGQGASLRQTIADGRVDVLKWCFLFWIGQVVAMTGIIGVMFRLFRP
jgi:hypothetical protein